MEPTASGRSLGRVEAGEKWALFCRYFARQRAPRLRPSVSARAGRGAKTRAPLSGRCSARALRTVRVKNRVTVLRGTAQKFIIVLLADSAQTLARLPAHTHSLSCSPDSFDADFRAIWPALSCPSARATIRPRCPNVRGPSGPPRRSPRPNLTDQPAPNDPWAHFHPMGWLLPGELELGEPKWHS